jgi:hypothetical protein
VRIADDLKKSTVFLGDDIAGKEGEQDIDARATGFFVSWSTSASLLQPDDDQQEQGAKYLITARHCARQLGSKFVIRYNKHDGGSEVELVEDPQWVFHPDCTVDVAALHCGYPKWADCVPVPGRLLLRPAERQSWTEAPSPIVAPNAEVGIGDIAYVVGLFNPLRETRINLPVVYTGHIALLPNDYRIQVFDQQTRITQEVECYLVQAPGLDGLSGAPVFCRISHPIYGDYRAEPNPPQRGRHQPIPARVHGMTHLLGLWQSSWADPPDETLARHSPSTIGRKVPVGFGVVVPAYKIAEMLNLPELIAARRAEYERRRRESAATIDVRSQ